MDNKELAEAQALYDAWRYIRIAKTLNKEEVCVPKDVYVILWRDARSGSCKYNCECITCTQDNCKDRLNFNGFDYSGILVRTEESYKDFS